MFGDWLQVIVDWSGLTLPCLLLLAILIVLIVKGGK